MEEAAKNWKIPKKVKFNKETYKNICGDDLAEEPAGFCRSRKHIGYLSASQVRNHECVSKSCPYLIRNENHIFWQKRNEAKTFKKYNQLLEKLYYDKSITPEKYKKLRDIKDLKQVQNLLLSLDPRVEENTKKGKIYIFEIVGDKAVKRTQDQISTIFFGKNNTKCRQFCIELSKSINDKNYIIEKRKITQVYKYKDAIYRFITIGQHILVYGKGIHEDYMQDIIRIAHNYNVLGG